MTGLTPRAIRAAAIADQRARAEVRANQVREFAVAHEVERALARAEKRGVVQEPAQAPAKPIAHASGELRVDLGSEFDHATDGPEFKRVWADRGYDVVGVRLAAGHAVVVRQAAQANAA